MYTQTIPPELTSLARCAYTEVLAGDTGENAAPCNSLATNLCSEHGDVCEFHAALCVLGEYTEVL